MRDWTVHVIDSSSLIRIKHDYAAAEQWTVCEQIKRMVELGHAAFPKQVHREVARVQHPDTPGAMIDFLHQARSVQFTEPDDETVRRVLAAAPLLHDWDARQDPADAYVVAMALELHESDGLDGIVVSADVIDRPNRTSVSTACDRLGLPCVSLADLLIFESEGSADSFQEWQESRDGQVRFPEDESA